MSTVATGPSLNDPDLLRRVNELRRTDNWTNWYYLAREYAFVALVLTGPLVAFHFIDWSHWTGWLVAVLVTVPAVLAAGACQHRLAALTHEAAHYILFRNRQLNEFVSEWFCMLPLLSTTHGYRVQHHGHHQFPNDPIRDPDWAQMTQSGHKFHFPMSASKFLWHCVVKQALLPFNLLRYALVRAGFTVKGPEETRYRLGGKRSRVVKLVRGLYHVLLIGVALPLLLWRGDAALAAIVPLGFLAVGLVALQVIPSGLWVDYLIKCDFTPRFRAQMKMTWNTLFFGGLVWLSCATGRPWWLWIGVLWLLPLGTSFSFFMILRQIVQHGNADKGRLTNTRIFHVHPLLSFGVFPLGQDYHLPHHVFPMVPHYRLRELHELLMECPSYREQAAEVEGYFVPSGPPPRRPTVLEVMTK